MIRYTIKRLFQSLITVLLVVSAVFLLLRLLPTDYFFTADQLIKLDEHEQEDMLRMNGYLDHPFVQLGRFYSELVKSEHQPHYFDRVNMVDANTVEISFLESDAAKLLSADDITIQSVEERPLTKSSAVAVSEEAGKENVIVVTAKGEIEKDTPYRISLKEYMSSGVANAVVSDADDQGKTLVLTVDSELETGIDYVVRAEEYPVLKPVDVAVVTASNGNQKAEEEPAQTSAVQVTVDRAVERGVTYSVTCEGYSATFKATGFGSELKITTENGKDYFESVNVKDANNIVITFKAEDAAEAVKAENVVFAAITPTEYKGSFEFWGDDLTENVQADGAKRFFRSITKIDPVTYELKFLLNGSASYVKLDTLKFSATKAVEHTGTFTLNADGEGTIVSDTDERFFGSVRLLDAKTVEVEILKEDMAQKVSADHVTFRNIQPHPFMGITEANVVPGPEGADVIQLKLDAKIEKKTDYQIVCGNHTGRFELKKEGWERAAKINSEATDSAWDHLTHMKVWLNFGNSHRVQTGKPVVEIIGSKITVSLSIGLAALAIALLIGVPLGILQARYKDGIFDAVGQGYTIFINAVPHLVTYFLIMIIGSRIFGLPISYSTQSPLLSSILPVFALAMGSIASYMLWMRRYMVDELNKDYIRLAKLKGMSTTQVMFRHVMKNAFLPLAQYLPYSVLLTVGGSILVEKMFGVPGLGSLLPDAIAKYDTNLVQAVVSLYASLGILGLFLGDVLMIVLDPRIRLTEKGGTR